jgi:hypothetical protein
MIRLNITSRISVDKNFFVDFIVAVYKAGLEIGQEKIALTFIGQIQDKGVYETLLRLVYVLGLNEQVEFTKRSIPLSNLPENMKEGYFINFSAGNFIGYSGIECMGLGFKTIFLNVDDRYAPTIDPDQSCYCPSFSALTDMILKIYRDQNSFDLRILEENRLLYAGYFLTENEERQLIEILAPSASATI